MKTMELTGGIGSGGHCETTHGRASRGSQVLTTPGQRCLPAAGLAALRPVASLGPDLPCTDDPELFFAESPDDVETAKASCRECPGRAACLAGALERREPWGVWCGELFLRGAIVPGKRALLDQHALRPVISHVLPLAAAARAHRIVEGQHAGGKIGLDVASS